MIARSGSSNFWFDNGRHVATKVNDVTNFLCFDVAAFDFCIAQMTIGRYVFERLQRLEDFRDPSKFTYIQFWRIAAFELLKKDKTWPRFTSAGKYDTRAKVGHRMTKIWARTNHKHGGWRNIQLVCQSSYLFEIRDCATPK